MIRRIGLAALLLPVLGVVSVAQTPASAPSQQYFQTPRAAADAMLDACKNNDTPALIRMLGDQYRLHVDKVDDAEERRHRQDIYEKASALLKLDEQGDAKVVIVIGRELWPVPIPLVKEAAGWRFDTAAGMQEMLARRIGENELSTIDVCHEYVRAQVDYAAIDRDGDDVREFAQQIVSAPDKRDGLYWELAPESRERPSPLAAFLPEAIINLKDCKPGTPYMGYHFKILTRQGSNPPGGKYDYVINGNMIAGFALVAWPADYRSSGVMTFVISHQGRLFEKDLGPDTAKLVSVMTEYDPDKTWNRVDEP